MRRTEFVGCEGARVRARFRVRVRVRDGERGKGRGRGRGIELGLRYATIVLRLPTFAGSICQGIIWCR